MAQWRRVMGPVASGDLQGRANLYFPFFFIENILSAVMAVYITLLSVTFSMGVKVTFLTILQLLLLYFYLR